MTPLSRAVIVAEARRWIGTPYAHQASLIDVGCDCLGLVRGVWRATHGPEPEAPGPYAPRWPMAARDEPLLAAAARHLRPRPLETIAPGDVLLFRWRAGLPASHLGVLVGDRAFVHAHEGAAVAEAAFTPWWRRRLAALFSFPGLID
jgi:NlpC/P60 family putative phage cell wall peptidase